MREFETGATRDTEDGKLDFEGFFSPEVWTEFAKYMHEHRVQADGELRAADNWQKGMPLDAYMKSAFRHFMDLWSLHRGIAVARPETGEHVSLHDALGGLMFNLQGYWHELLQYQRTHFKGLQASLEPYGKIFGGTEPHRATETPYTFTEWMRQGWVDKVHEPPLFDEPTLLRLEEVIVDTIKYDDEVRGLIKTWIIEEIHNRDVTPLSRWEMP